MKFGVNILDNSYRIVASQDQIGRSLRDLMSGFLTQEAIHDGPTIEITAKRKVRGLGPEALEYDSDEDLLVSLEHDLYRHALLASDDLIIHSAVLQARERTILLIGSSGAGKTTLTLGLGNRGWTFLSDEVAPLAPGQGFVRPFPRCPGASKNTMEMLGLHPESTQHIHLRGTYCLLPRQFQLAEVKRHAIDDVVFLCRSNTTVMTSVSRTAGMTRLLQSLSHEPDRSVVFQTTGEIAGRARFFDLQNGELSASIEKLESLV